MEEHLFVFFDDWEHRYSEGDRQLLKVHTGTQTMFKRHDIGKQLGTEDYDDDDDDDIWYDMMMMMMMMMVVVVMMMMMMRFPIKHNELFGAQTNPLPTIG